MAGLERFSMRSCVTEGGTLTCVVKEQFSYLSNVLPVCHENISYLPSHSECCLSDIALFCLSEVFSIFSWFVFYSTNQLYIVINGCKLSKNVALALWMPHISLLFCLSEFSWFLVICMIWKIFPFLLCMYEFFLIFSQMSNKIA